jgi:hypothetical protein
LATLSSASSTVFRGPLERLAGRGSKLAAKYKVHLRPVTVATVPEDYESRLKETFSGRFKKLKILAPDPYDLVLSKLERNSPEDQGDVEYLAKTLLKYQNLPVMQHCYI